MKTLAFVLLMASPSTAPQAPPAQSEIETQTQAWHQGRIARLTADDGWLTLVGLHWLKEGDNRFGSAKDNDVVFPPGTPAHMGVLVRQGNAVKLQPTAGTALLKDDQPFAGGPLRSDAEGKPDVLKLGTLRFFVIQRGDKLGIRVKDSEAEARRKFHGIPMYPPSPAWRIEARFEPAKTSKTLAVPTVLGTVDQMASPGTALFTVGGKEYRLDPVQEPGSNQLFFIFADQTNRTETYGAGRFLYTELPSNGRVVLDFNRAINPPCAFSPYATCPLPPPQNRLSLRVEAGEKRYGNH
jgi:uncharacterized protein (DUF1684 family)